MCHRSTHYISALYDENASLASTLTEAQDWGMGFH